MAETSATSGGLDSLLDPVGPLKLAQESGALMDSCGGSFVVAFDARFGDNSIDF